MSRRIGQLKIDIQRSRLFLYLLINILQEMALKYIKYSYLEKNMLPEPGL